MERNSVDPTICIGLKIKKISICSITAHDDLGVSDRAVENGFNSLFQISWYSQIAILSHRQRIYRTIEKGVITVVKCTKRHIEAPCGSR